MQKVKREGRVRYSLTGSYCPRCLHREKTKEREEESLRQRA